MYGPFCSVVLYYIYVSFNVQKKYFQVFDQLSEEDATKSIPIITAALSLCRHPSAMAVILLNSCS